LPSVIKPVQSPGPAARKNLAAALIGAGVCIFFLRSGFLYIFFLVPLGVVAFVNGYRSAWIAFVIAAALNLSLAISTALAVGSAAAGIFWDVLFFTAMALMFTWIAAPPPGFSQRLSGSVRLIAGSCIGALLFTLLFFRAIASPPFSEAVDSWISSFLSLYRSADSDVVQNAILDSITADLILDTMKSIMLRGGSLVSIILLFFICRQFSLGLANLLQRLKGREVLKTGALAAFHVYPAVIWVFSGSLFLVVLARISAFEVPEIILWNILILCGILYLAQGLGILQFFLIRTSVSPMLRFFLLLLFFILIVSPVLNVIFVAGILLLGIAENWAPLRAQKNNGPPSTPGAGDGES